MPINLYEGELFYSSGNGHVYLKTGANQGRKAFFAAPGSSNESTHACSSSQEIDSISRPDHLGIRWHLMADR